MTAQGRTGAGAQAGGGRTLVVQTAFLGDVVLTTPLLSALARRDGPVDVVTTPAAAPLLEGHPAVRRVIRYDKRGADAGLPGLWRLGAALRRDGYRRAVLPHRSWRSAALAVLADVPERVGFAGGAPALTYSTRVPRAREGHEVERLLALAGRDAGPVPPVALGLTAADRTSADTWLAARGIDPGFVALAPGSIWGTKRWPYYPELAAALARPVVVIGSRDDAELATAVVAAARRRAHSAAGELDLRTAAALLARASVLVTNDSAPLHLATAVGTPIVALFGPTVPAQGFGPRGAADRTLGVALGCRPCSAHGPRICPLVHHRCMRDLTVEQVAEAVAAAATPEDRVAIRPGH
ncbi:MAG TPA: lipopolysaccharide heptosyltransferase II [Gaiellales bacterium]|nr:lipopolysaccharide heptosyltransferase II [Gaiellales bacterium]